MKNAGIFILILGAAAAIWFSRPAAVNPPQNQMTEEQIVQRAAELEPGISSGELLAALGKPLQVFNSKDGKYEMLRFPSPPTQMDLTSAVVDVENGTVVSIKADGVTARNEEGFNPARLEWDYPQQGAA